MEKILQIIEGELSEITGNFESEFSENEQRFLDKGYSREMHFAHDQGAIWALEYVCRLIKERA
jgi:hypothetical protein